MFAVFQMMLPTGAGQVRARAAALSRVRSALGFKRHTRASLVARLTSTRSEASATLREATALRLARCAAKGFA